MRRTVYILLFGLFMGYFVCFSSFTQNALAAPQVIKIHNAVSSSEKPTYDQHDTEKRIGVMENKLDKASHSSENRVGKVFRSTLLRNTSTSEAFSQHAFDFPWPSLKALDISSLWKQQRDKQKRKDVYDYGE
jgi:hypothetical protein